MTVCDPLVFPPSRLRVVCKKGTGTLSLSPRFFTGSAGSRCNAAVRSRRPGSTRARQSGAS